MRCLVPSLTIQSHDTKVDEGNSIVDVDMCKIDTSKLGAMIKDECVTVR